MLARSATIARSSAATSVRAVHTLPALSFDLKEGIAPVISANQLEFHYNKHHKAYVDKCNALVKGTIFESKALEEIILETANDSARAGLFNNAAQHWNHSFYWKCMKPGGGSIPEGLKVRIERDFGSVDGFKDKFAEYALAQFGSGWTWLVDNKGKLEIVNKSNAGNPMTDNKIPLLTCDVWEHAYYLDHQNRRPEYVANWFKVVDWEFVAKNLRV